MNDVVMGVDAFITFEYNLRALKKKKLYSRAKA